MSILASGLDFYPSYLKMCTNTKSAATDATEEIYFGFFFLLRTKFITYSRNN